MYYGCEREICQSLRAWCRQAREFLMQLPEQATGLHDPLHRWHTMLASLEQDASWHLQAAEAGLSNPMAFFNLIESGRQASAAFNRFVESNRLTWKERTAMEPERSVPIGQHRLPPLPYAYDALEPYIDAQTMHLHHDRHHRSYVEGLNKAERMMAQARESGNYDLLRHWEREAAFNGAGHYLHTIFWHNMSPAGGGEPHGALAEQIARDFGSFERFKQHFSAAAEQAEGVGWALLVWAPRAHHLEILQSEKHQNLSQWDVIPLLVLDVWEHAYYLKYQNERKRYIEAWWNLVNWDNVAERFEKARRLKWEPF